MMKTKKIALAALVPVMLLAACTDFLKGPGISTNPNQPTTATPDQLWVGVEVAVMAQYENYPLMLFMTWAQGLAGSNRQWQTYGSYNGGTTSGTANGAWDQTYGPGGLRDLRQIRATIPGTDLTWIGEAQVLEALYMGTAADIWGSVPYSDALTAQPTFDSQSTVYSHVQSLLDSAITNLRTGGGTLPIADFFYNNNATQWKQLAYTLKARFLMHNAKTPGDTTYSVSTLNAVLSATDSGIASAAGDFKPLHNNQPGQQNLFYSFQFSRAGDVEPAATHINLVKAAGESSMLPTYYIPGVGAGGSYFGAAAGSNVDPYDLILNQDSIATFEVTNDPSAEWPFVSYAENQMLRAEAQYRTGATAAAITTLNAYRATVGASALAPTTWHILEDILREKFIHEFYNMEPWNDYVRTCYPNIPQPIGVNPTANYVPARLPVADDEQQSNPNVPAQPAGNPPNPNFTYPASLAKRTAIDGTTACIGQQTSP